MKTKAPYILVLATFAAACRLCAIIQHTWKCAKNLIVAFILHVAIEKCTDYCKFRMQKVYGKMILTTSISSMLTLGTLD
jgi:hypothetical protein